MSDKKFTPPDVVYLPKFENNWALAYSGDGSTRNITIASDTETNVHEVSYTLTSSVEKAKREAVRIVLEEVKCITHNKYNDAVVIQQEIDALFSQYQEPTTNNGDKQ